MFRKSHSREVAKLSYKIQVSLTPKSKALLLCFFLLTRTRREMIPVWKCFLIHIMHLVEYFPSSAAVPCCSSPPVNDWGVCGADLASQGAAHTGYHLSRIPPLTSCHYTFCWPCIGFVQGVRALQWRLGAIV